MFVDELAEVPPGATVVFSAHGVPPEVWRQAEALGLHVVDATCPLVAKVHAEARRFATRGDTVVLIGHAGHEETEGTLLLRARFPHARGRGTDDICYATTNWQRALAAIADEADLVLVVGSAGRVRPGPGPRHTSSYRRTQVWRCVPRYDGVCGALSGSTGSW